jgi:hypothetical protein
MAVAAISMNGPGSPDFPIPTWVLVNEELWWKAGFPNAIGLINNSTVCDGEQCLAIFSNEQEASDFLTSTQMGGMRPLAITELVVFLAVLNRFIGTGLKHVVSYWPRIPGRELWECDAIKLRTKLAEEAKRR